MMNNFVKGKKVFSLAIFLFYLLLIFLCFSCTRLGNLGGKEHRFDDSPTRIVWLQVPGLQEEHFAMLYFSMATINDRPSFFKARCLGKTWSFNLYKIRPSSFAGFMSQMTGKKNIKDSCDDMLHTPIWKYIKEDSVKKMIFEHEVSSNDSLLKMKLCPESDSYLSNTTFFSMNASANAISADSYYFHAQENSDFVPGTVYYDRACQKGKCYNSLARNLEHIFENTINSQNDFLFIIRDFSYENALRKKKLSDARKSLIELEKIFAFFAGKAEEQKHFLLILTSSAPRTFSFPEQGIAWSNFEQNTNYVLQNENALLSTVIALGARAENFCGIYDESDILPRLIFDNKKFGFDSFF